MALSLDMLDCRKLPQRLVPGEGDTDPAVAEAEVSPLLESLDAETHAAWGGGLSIPQYQKRERVLRATAFSQRGLRTWLLRDGDAGADVILASCESYAVDVLVGGRRGRGHGIASVWVSPARRGHGHASELLRRVHDVLRQEGALLCFLMSEIGPTLYQRLGYVPRPLYVRRYAAAEKDEFGSAPPWEWLPLESVGEALAARRPPPRALVVQPEAERLTEQVLWHIARSRFYAATLGKKAMRYVGARAKSQSGGSFALSLWAPDYKHEVLRVLSLYPGAQLASPGASFDPRSDEAAQLRNVLHAARAMAAELKLPAIEVWENPASAGYLRGGVRKDGEDLPMLLGLQPGVRGEDWLDYERAHWL